AMSSGFGIFLFGWLLPPLGAALGWLCDGSLAAMQSGVQVSRALRGSHYWVAGPSDWWLIGFYGALAIWLFAPRWAPPRRWCLALVAGWAALGLAMPLVRPREANRLQCTFLSVGHGAAVVVELPGGKTLLYDVGRLGAPSYAA